MSDIAIRVENLSKAYRIGLKEQQHETMLGAMGAWVKSPLRNFRELRNLSRFDEAKLDDREQNKETSPRSSTSGVPSSALRPPPSDIFWALRDVSFEVKRGEVLGIIGRNGAGKSTLLKILSRITEPTVGCAKLYGRVGSLLEVGTGFHPDLTGRENVYLNGTILGMKKREIDKKFDGIVGFSGVEQFIDTPVKRYSSGMRVRLAFAVAANLEPEILIVDEVLAVGDVQFQEKCLGKMDQVAKSGCTVLFVSHNMGAIHSLCSQAVLLKHGRMALKGEVPSAVAGYMDDAAPGFWKTKAASPENQPIWIKKVALHQGDQATPLVLDPSKSIQVRIEYQILHSMDNLLLGLDVLSSDGVPVFRAYDCAVVGMGPRKEGYYESVFTISRSVLQNRTYFVEIVAGIHRRGWITQGRIRLKVNCEGAMVSDVGCPGLIQAQGNWIVNQVEEISSRNC